MFDRTVDTEGLKTNDFKETVRAFLTMTTKNKRPKKISVDKGTEFAGEFQNLCKAEGLQIESTMIEIKTAFAECTIRFLKQILPLHGRLWIQVHSQIVLIRHNPEIQKKNVQQT